MSSTRSSPLASMPLTALLLAAAVSSCAGLTLPARSPSLARAAPPRAAAPLGASLRTATLATPARAPAVRMEDAPFWPNVQKFGRFFIATMSGLILGLLSPLAAFGRTPLLAAIGATFVGSVLVFFYVTLTNMQSADFTPPSVVPDQSIQQMMDEIYGPR